MLARISRVCVFFCFNDLFFLGGGGRFWGKLSAECPVLGFYDKLPSKSKRSQMKIWEGDFQLGSVNDIFLGHEFEGNSTYYKRHFGYLSNRTHRRGTRWVWVKNRRSGGITRAK